MILQTDVPVSGEVLECSVEFIFGAIWVLVRSHPGVEVSGLHLSTVDGGNQPRADTGEVEVIPLAIRLGVLRDRLLGIKKCSHDVLAPVEPGGSDLDFHTILHGVFRICAEEDTTVALLAGLVFQGERKVLIGLCAVDDATRCL